MRPPTHPGSTWLTVPIKKGRFYRHLDRGIVYCIGATYTYDADFQRVNDIKWHFLELASGKHTMLSEQNQVMRLRDIGTRR